MKDFLIHATVFAIPICPVKGRSWFMDITSSFTSSFTIVSIHQNINTYYFRVNKINTLSDPADH